MAILVNGMECKLCARPMHSSDDLTCFPPFVGNDKDPLMFFHDACFHATCFDRHPLAQSALQRIEEMEHATAIWPPKCTVCGRTISDPDEYLGFGHIADDVSDPLYAYNYTHIHRHCLPD